MKKIEAVFRPEKLEQVRDALAELGILGMIVMEMPAGYECYYPQSSWKGDARGSG
jgi:4-alpha-glucanotransferase